jgi:Putative DNA-binding domain
MRLQVAQSHLNVNGLAPLRANRMNVAAPSLALLAEQQNALLASIFTARAVTPSRGLAAYRANAHASAERALLAAYPVVAQLIGEESVHYLARDFWHQHPPRRGDLAQWGNALPTFIAASDQLADTPYLADVARIEWAVHCCAGAPDRTQSTASFALLAQYPPEALRFIIAPGAVVLPSAYPAATVVLAHQGQASMEKAAALWQAKVAQTGVVWRQGFAPRLRVLPDAEIAFTSAVCGGQNLAYALDQAHPDFDFSAWLNAQVQNGLLLGVTHDPSLARTSS